MSRKFLTPVNLTHGASLPATGLTGDIFYKTDDKAIFTFDGASWVEMGTTGPKGDTGDQGENGLSAYQVAQLNGFTGTEAEWLASLQGPTEGVPTFVQATAPVTSYTTYAWWDTSDVNNLTLWIEDGT